MQLTCRRSLDNVDYICLSNVPDAAAEACRVLHYQYRRCFAEEFVSAFSSYHSDYDNGHPDGGVLFNSCGVRVHHDQVLSWYGVSASLTDGELFLVAGVSTGDPRTGCGIAQSSRIRSRERCSLSIHSISDLQGAPRHGLLALRGTAFETLERTAAGVTTCTAAKRA